MSDAAPRTRMEVLYQDVLAEVGPLVQKLEALKEETEQLLSAAHGLPNDLGIILEQSAVRLDAEAAQEIRQITLKLEGIAETTRRHAVAAEKAAGKLVWLNIVAGAIAGCLSGILAGMALGNVWFSG